jgi:hypothetical protein
MKQIPAGVLHEFDIKTIEKVKAVDYLNNFKVDNIQFDINSLVEQ